MRASKDSRRRGDDPRAVEIYLLPELESVALDVGSVGQNSEEPVGLAEAAGEHCRDAAVEIERRLRDIGLKPCERVAGEFPGDQPLLDDDRGRARLAKIEGYLADDSAWSDGREPQRFRGVVGGGPFAQSEMPAQ